MEAPAAFLRYQQGLLPAMHQAVEKVTPQIVAFILRKLRDTLPIYGVKVAFGTADAAGENWVAFNNMADHSIKILLPSELTDADEYKSIDFEINLVHKNPVSGDYIIFLPDMPHLTKNIVTCLELSSSKSSRRSLKFGNCPVNLGMGEEVWLALGGNSRQLQETKLTSYHFDKNPYSRMNVALAMQVLSRTMYELIKMAIEDAEISLRLKIKEMYWHLAKLCLNWNTVVDICNGRDGDHTPDNGRKRQKLLLDVLAWFTEWKNIHDQCVAEETATKFNFFADETFFCIRALILAQVGAIQLYCLSDKKMKINPRTINTDCVEWFFGDGRQFVGGSSDKMAPWQWDIANFKAAALRASKQALVGNNKSGEQYFERNKRF